MGNLHLIFAKYLTNSILPYRNRLDDSENLPLSNLFSVFVIIDTTNAVFYPKLITTTV